MTAPAAFQNAGFQLNAFQTAPQITLTAQTGAITVAGNAVFFDPREIVTAGTIAVGGNPVKFINTLGTPAGVGHIVVVGNIAASNLRASGEVPGGTVLMPSKAGGQFSRKRFQKMLEDAERERAAKERKEAAEKKAQREAAKAKAIAAREVAKAVLAHKIKAQSEQTRQILNQALMGAAQAPHELHRQLIHTEAVHAMGQAAMVRHQEAMRQNRAKDDEEAMRLLLND